MKRIHRLNSLLKRVLSEVIKKDLVHNPDVHPLTTVTKVSISSDLHHAKVYISVIGSKEEKEKTVKALQAASGYIATQASKKVVMRYFPSLTFYIDTSADDFFKIETILNKIKKEQKSRKKIDEN